jgi:predicted metal-dependent peptidase
MSTNLHPQIQRCYDLALRGAWHHPFFLIPLGHVEWNEGKPETCQTMQVHSRITGKGRDAKPEIGLWINPEWVKTVPDDQIFGCLAHEIMHSLMRHHERIGDKNRETWGKAADMAINASLVQSGIKLPPYALLPPHGHEEDAAEELYSLLEAEEIQQPKGYDPGKVGAGCMPQKHAPQDEQGQGEGGQDSNGDASGSSQGSGEGEGEGSGGGNGDGEGEGEGQGSGEGEGNGDRVWGEMIAQAQTASRGTGSAKVMARVFTPKPSKTKWERLLRSAANRATARGGRDQQTYARVSRRSGDIVLPGWQSNRPSISVMIDSSGSVSDEMLRSALTAVKECARISGVKIFLAVHAWECYFADWLKPEITVEQISALCTDRGGTNCEGAFKAIAEARGRFDQCVYLTDGEVGTYPEKPDNVKNMIVGILGNRPSTFRAAVPDAWREVLVEIE